MKIFYPTLYILPYFTYWFEYIKQIVKIDWARLILTEDYGDIGDILSV